MKSVRPIGSWPSLKDIYWFTEGDFLHSYRKVKKEITGRMTEQFPVLEEEVLFEVRSGAWNCSFKLVKTLIP